LEQDAQAEDRPTEHDAQNEYHPLEQDAQAEDRPTEHDAEEGNEVYNPKLSITLKNSSTDFVSRERICSLCGQGTTTAPRSHDLLSYFQRLRQLCPRTSTTRLRQNCGVSAN
jgi:hypothetical protein